jgi:hypothetical protein
MSSSSVSKDMCFLEANQSNIVGSLVIARITAETMEADPTLNPDKVMISLNVYTGSGTGSSASKTSFIVPLTKMRALERFLRDSADRVAEWNRENKL